MASKNREHDLSQSLMNLQSLYNQAIQDKNWWSCRAEVWKKEYEREEKERKVEVSELKREVSRLTELLSRATRFEALSTTKKRHAARENAKRTEA
jgi:hypothetical protein